MLRYKRSLIHLCLVLLCSYFLSSFFFFFGYSVHYPNQRITIHIIPRIHKCVPGPLCNSLIGITITNTFDPLKKKKNLHFYTLTREWFCLRSIVWRSIFCWFERVWCIQFSGNFLFLFTALSVLYSCWWLLDFNLFVSLLDNISDSDFSFSFVLL